MEENQETIEEEPPRPLEYSPCTNTFDGNSINAFSFDYTPEKPFNSKSFNLGITTQTP